MQENFLEEIGLTKGEIRVYLALLSLGQTTSGPIISESNISSSKVYEIIDKLMHKGLASYTVKNNTKYFQATSPHKLRTFLENKQDKIQQQQDQLKQFLPQLMHQFKSNKISEDAQVFVGTKAMKTMLYDIVDNADKKKPFLFFAGSGKGYEKAVKNLYAKYAEYRFKKGLKVKGLAHISQKPVQLKANQKATMKFVDFPLPSNIGIHDDKVFILSWSDKQTGFLITSKLIADQFTDFFNSVWAMAKK